MDITFQGEVLKKNEGLTGEKALRNMSHLLILKLLEPHFGKCNDDESIRVKGQIDLDGYDHYDFTTIIGEKNILKNNY